jgi:hypothetical protein
MTTAEHLPDEGTGRRDLLGRAVDDQTVRSSEARGSGAER